MIKLAANGKYLRTKTTEILTTNSVGVTAELTTDSAWEGLTITVVFRAGETERIAPCINAAAGVYLVPWEVFAAANDNQNLLAGVCGMRGNEIVYPTIYAYCGQIKRGADPSATPGAEPTPSGYQLMLELVEEAVDAAGRATPFAEAAERSAEDAEAAARSAAEYASQTAAGVGQANAAAEAAARSESNAADAATAAGESAGAARESENAAGQSAQAGAESADTAQRAAQIAGEAANQAGAGAQAAVNAANAAAGSANGAAESALAAAAFAAEIEDMTVEAETLEAGEPATVTKSRVDEVYNLAFGIPQGPRGYSGNYPLVADAVSTSVTLEMAANTEYVYSAGLSALTLSFGAAAVGYSSEYRIRFLAGNTAPTVAVPASVLWSPAAPSFEANTTYELSFVPLGGAYMGIWTGVS